MAGSSLDHLVRQRASDRCEYCRLPQAGVRLRFPLDHVVARQHDGPTNVANLALCCNRCNSYKGPNLTGLDPADGATMRLFNPRLDDWNEHFEWKETLVIGRTPVGRTTVKLLRMNDPIRAALREQLLAEGLMTR